MLCPKCKHEYKEGLTVCPDCDVLLVEWIQPNGAAVAPDNTWVEICTIPKGTMSILVKGALNSSNIPSEIVPNEFSARRKTRDSVSGRSRSAGKGNIILVPDEFREDAIIVLEAVLGDDVIESERS
jgi:hypothetical protein